MAQLCDAQEQIGARGATLVIVGNGTPEQAKLFVASRDVRTQVYTDPDLVTYQAVGAKSGLGSSLRWGAFRAAFRAWRKGFRQSEVLGEPMQQGGVFILLPNGTTPYAYVSDFAGDHPEVERVLEALSNVA